MKRRIRKIVNFFAFNLLFFALYLNFIHKDRFPAEPVAAKINGQTSINGTVPVQDAEKYLTTKAAASATHTVGEKNSQESVVKPSVN